MLVVQSAAIESCPLSWDDVHGRLGLLLSRSLGLCCLLLVAFDHDNSDEGAYDGRTQECEDDGDADGPNTGREDVVERVAGVNKGL